MPTSFSEKIMSKRTRNNIKWTCNEIRDLLLSKNEAYGDSALSPENIFSKLDNAQAICARIDDKLSRIKNNGLDDATEDTLDDLIGYLILLKIARQTKGERVTVYTSCNCERGCTICSTTCECTCNIEPTGYIPPWSQEIPKDVRVFTDDKSEWVCKACGKDTSMVDYDYLAARDLHLECALKAEMKEKNMKRKESRETIVVYEE